MLLHLGGRFCMETVMFWMPIGGLVLIFIVALRPSRHN
jgi:hypothetical protein